MRSFLSCYRHGEIDINAIQTDGIISSRPIFDNTLGVAAANFTREEINYYRHKIYDQVTSGNTQSSIFKVHDAYQSADDLPPILNIENAKVLYLVRNPLDVAVSFSFHRADSIESTIAFMNAASAKLSANREKLNRQLNQSLLTWSQHVKSWTQHKNTLVIRYEDMKYNPYETFSKVLTFLGVAYDKQSLVSVLSKVSFSKLQEQEKVYGFKEKYRHAETFFRKGRVGDWQNHLTSRQVEAIIECHRDIMVKFNYLDANDNPILEEQ